MIKNKNAQKLSKRTFLLRKLKARPQPKGAPKFVCPDFDRPVFILSAPRAGSTLLFESLSQIRSLWTIGEENHHIFKKFPELCPENRNYESHRLIEKDLTPRIAQSLHKEFSWQLLDRNQRLYRELSLEERPTKLRFLEKTPKNSLRIPFLKKLFPNALFILLYRKPEENISSLIEGWQSQWFLSFSDLPSWPIGAWSFLLPPDWISMKNKSLAEVAAFQWKSCYHYILKDLKDVSASSCFYLSFSQFLDKPEKTVKEICDFIGVEWDTHMDQFFSRTLPASQTTISSPAPDKWRKNKREILPLIPGLEPIIQQWENKLGERNT